MKLKIYKFIALLAFLICWFSCTSDSNNINDIQDDQKVAKEYPFKWDGSDQQEEFRPINPGKTSSYFEIDSSMISFAVPYLVGTMAAEFLPQPGYGSPEGYSPHLYAILLIMAEGVDVTTLSPIITLAPGATITQIVTRKEPYVSNEPDFNFMQVNYTGIAEVGVFNLKHSIEITVLNPDGSTTFYQFPAIAIGDMTTCSNCP